jgi:N-acetylglucosamine kinase-like BadF-type ATPase
MDEHGQVLFQGHSGPANILSTPPHLLRKNLCQATEGCPEPTSICGCFAGLVNESEAQRGEMFLKELFPSARIKAVPDYCAAYMACP